MVGQIIGIDRGIGFDSVDQGVQAGKGRDGRAVSLTVSSGSRRATSGKRCGLTIPFFRFSRVSERMAIGVTSLPVPAVVGIRITGTPGRGTRSTPKNWRQIPSGLVSITEVTLAISNELPPPYPIRRSIPSFRAAFRQASTTSSGDPARPGQRWPGTARPPPGIL